MIDDLNYILLYYTTYWLIVSQNLELSNWTSLGATNSCNCYKTIYTLEKLRDTLYWMFRNS